VTGAPAAFRRVWLGQARSALGAGLTGFGLAVGARRGSARRVMGRSAVTVAATLLASRHPPLREIRLAMAAAR
jgi:hypothetical protein